MKVNECRRCKHYTRKVWSSSYKPLNYHEIGVSHAYAFCEKHKTRCLTVKKCKVDEKNGTKGR